MYSLSLCIPHYSVVIVFDLARPVDHTQSSTILELIMKMIWIQYDDT